MSFFGLFPPKIEKLSNNGDIAGLIKALGYEKQDVQQNAAKALKQIGRPAVELLIAALKDPNPVVRLYSVDLLGEMGDTRAVEPLIAAFKDYDNYSITTFREALEKLRDARAVEPFIAALKNDDVNVRSVAARALGEIGDARAVEPLIDALKDSDSYVRYHSAEALGEIGDAHAVEPLIEALKDSDAAVRSVAARAVGEIGDARAVEPLIEALKGSDSYVRYHSAEALGEIGNARAVEPLIDALKDSSSDVRSQAAWALGTIGSSAVEPLIAALKDSKSDVRIRAAEVLGEIGDERAVEPLIDTLDYSELSEQSHAAKALRKLGGARALAAIQKHSESMPTLHLLSSIQSVIPFQSVIPSLDDKKEIEIVVELLEKTNDQRAIEPLKQVLKTKVGDDTALIMRCVMALAKLGDRSELKRLIHRIDIGLGVWPEIFELMGGPEVVLPLLKLVKMPSWNAESTLKALENVLRKDATKIRLEDLQSIVQLKNVLAIEANPDPDRLTPIKVELDTRYLQTIAQEEISRRSVS